MFVINRSLKAVEAIQATTCTVAQTLLRNCCTRGALKVPSSLLHQESPATGCASVLQESKGHEKVAL